MTLRQELAVMLGGYRAATLTPRHAELDQPATSRRRRRATLTAKDLAPETKDPSPE